MNKLSTKDNKGYCICVAVFSIISVLVFILSIILDLSLLQTRGALLSVICTFLADLSSTAAFTILSILMILRSSKRCTYNTNREMLHKFIILYSVSNFMVFALSLLSLFRLFKSICFCGILSADAFGYSYELMAAIFLERSIFCIIMMIYYLKNKLSCVSFKLITITMFISVLSVITYENLCRSAGFVTIIEYILLDLPIFLYFLFYNRINTPCDSKIKRNSIEEQLIDLKEKLDSGLITLEEYNTVKQNILSKINNE